MGEFELIKSFFARPAHSVVLGNGDDCALIDARPGQVLAVSTDMLVAGRHFFADVDAHALGFKALAVNLSDLAAMAATPRAFTLALALPDANLAWLQRFAEGLFACADDFGCELIGGDTTRGPLTMSITVFGDVFAAAAPLRSGARLDDDVWVSGELGGAALALLFERQRRGIDAEISGAASASLLKRLHYPQARIALALQLSGLVHAMIDLSDGLCGDLQHILDASSCGAVIDEGRLPCPSEVASQNHVLRRRLTLAGGDDYELCFCAPAQHRASIEAAAAAVAVGVTRIGTIVAERQLVIRSTHGVILGAEELVNVRGFDHFA